MHPSGPPVESVDRALLLLGLLRSQGSVTVTDAAAYLGVAPSTAHRLLSALAYRDYALQDHLRRYRIGPAFADPSLRPPAIGGLLTAARPALEYISQHTGETCQLQVIRRGDVQFIDGIESEHRLRVAMRRGDTMPAFTSAGGKALLSLLPNQELEELYRGGVPTWPTSRVQTLTALKRRMTRIRHDGYATNFEETEQGVVGVGIALVNHLGRPLVGLTTATPSLRFGREKVASHVEVLRHAGRLLEAALAQPTS